MYPASAYHIFYMLKAWWERLQTCIHIIIIISNVPKSEKHMIKVQHIGFGIKNKNKEVKEDKSWSSENKCTSTLQTNKHKLNHLKCFFIGCSWYEILHSKQTS